MYIDGFINHPIMSWLRFLQTALDVINSAPFTNDVSFMLSFPLPDVNKSITPPS